MDKRLKLHLYIGLLTVAALHILFAILGEDSFILIHDNLDGNFAMLNTLKFENILFSGSSGLVLDNVMNGLDVSYLHSNYNIVRIFFYFFSSIDAYIFNSLVIRMIGVVGVFMLAKDYIPIQLNAMNTLLIALAFSIGPMYPLYGLTILGQPILLWAFLNLRNRKKTLISYLLIIFFALYAHIALIGPFIVIALITYYIYCKYWKQKIVSTTYFYGLTLLILTFCLSNSSMIETFVHKAEPTSRDSWIFSHHTFMQMARDLLEVVLAGTYHASYVLGLVPLLLAVYSVIKKTENHKNVSMIMIAIFLIAIFKAFYKNIAATFSDSLHILTSFNFSRFTFLVSLLYTIILLFFNSDKRLNSRLLLFSFITYFAFAIFSNAEVRVNTLKLIQPNQPVTEHPSFESYFATDLFTEIKDYIGLEKSEYRVVSLGLHPSIALYNGFYSLDAYLTNYRYSYKQQFREVLDDELEKNKRLKEYYDNWGSRCYLFSAELRNTCYVNCHKNLSIGIKQLSIDVDALRRMKGKYIFSAVSIDNAMDLNLQLMKIFKNDKAHWTIYLYEIPDRQEKNE